MKEIQYSIYKLSNEKIIEQNDNIFVGERTDEILSKLMNNFNTAINRKEGNKCSLYEKDDFHVLLIETNREPNWASVIRYLGDVDDDIELSNKTLSFVITININDEIFALTAGNGSHYLDKIKEIGFGQNIITKITSKSDRNIKAIGKIGISSNELSSTSVMKEASSPLDQIDYNTILTKINIQDVPNILKQFDIDYEGKRKVNIAASDQLKIQKSITLQDLKKVLISITKLEKLSNNFEYSYLISTKNIEKPSVLDQLQNEQLLENPDFIEIIIPAECISNVSRYKLIYNGESEELDTLELSDIWNFIAKCTDKKITKTFLKDFFQNCNYIIFDEQDRDINSGSLENLVSCSLENNGQTFYKINGRWFVYDKNKYEIIKREYEALYDEIEQYRKSISIIDEINLIVDKASNEDSYNKSFKTNNKVIVGHLNMQRKVEIADLIFYDDNNVYIMCNKSKMDGAGVRDLLGQIRMSAEIINGYKTSRDLKNFLEKYYDSLNESERSKISKNDFVNLFNSKKIFFVAGFSNNYKRNTTSVHCQAQFKATDLELKKYNFGFLALNYTINGLTHDEKKKAKGKR